MTDLRIRAYNVAFGDAILLSIPDHADDGSQVTRHVMVDFGNLLMGEAGNDDVFEPIIDDVLKELDGEPLDLFVASHEHLDHVQGPIWAAEKLGKELTARQVWLPASAHPDYYDNFPDARKAFTDSIEIYAQIQSIFGFDTGHTSLNHMMLNNNPRSTADAVDKLRAMGEPVYVHREAGAENDLPFNDFGLTVWAPEEDTSVYYGRFKRMALGAAGASMVAEGAESRLAPPPGVDAGAFFDLTRLRRTGVVENLFSIDKARNNSSLVFSIDWQGWHLLFPGDAEERSWKHMNLVDGLIRPIDFLKVSHHGSHNGTPDGEILDTLLEMPNPDGGRRIALISTHPDGFDSIPDQSLMDELELRMDDVRCTTEVDPGEFIDIVLEPR